MVKLLLFALFLVFLTSVTVPVHATWWDTDYKNCRNWTLTEQDGQTRVLMPVIYNATGMDGKIASSDDFRIINKACGESGGLLIDYEILSNTSTSVYFATIVNLTANTANVFSFYYNKSDAVSVDNPSLFLYANNGSYWDSAYSNAPVSFGKDGMFFNATTGTNMYNITNITSQSNTTGNWWFTYKMYLMKTHEYGTGLIIGDIPAVPAYDKVVTYCYVSDVKWNCEDGKGVNNLLLNSATLNKWYTFVANISMNTLNRTSGIMAMILEGNTWVSIGTQSNSVNSMDNIRMWGTYSEQYIKDIFLSNSSFNAYNSSALMTTGTAQSYILSDTLAPTIIINAPINITYSYNTSLPLNYTAGDDTGLDKCWYNLDNDGNVTLTGCVNATFNTSEDSHVLYMFANDTKGNLNNTEHVHFTVRNWFNTVAFVSPTPNNEVIIVNHAFINVTVNSSYTVDRVLLEWNGVNESMSNTGGIYNYSSVGTWETEHNYPVASSGFISTWNCTSGSCHWLANDDNSSDAVAYSCPSGTVRMRLYLDFAVEDYDGFAIVNATNNYRYDKCGYRGGGGAYDSLCGSGSGIESSWCVYATRTQVWTDWHDTNSVKFHFCSDTSATYFGLNVSKYQCDLGYAVMTVYMGSGSSSYSVNLTDNYIASKTGLSVGNYTFRVYSNDSTGGTGTDGTRWVKYELPFASVVLNYSAVSYGLLSENTVNNPATNNYQIGVDTNCAGANINFSALNPTLTSGGYNIPSSNMKFNYTVNTNNYPDLLAFNADRLVSVVDNDVVYPEYYLDIPASQYAGLYTGKQFITASCS